MLEVYAGAIFLFFLGGIGFYLARRGRKTGIVPIFNSITKKDEPGLFEIAINRYALLGFVGFALGAFLLIGPLLFRP